MGAISDGSSKIYTCGESGKTVVVADENRKRGIAQHSFGGLTLAKALPELLMGGCNKFDKFRENKNVENTKDKETETKIEELKTELNGYLTALNIKSADQINEAVSTAQDNYASKGIAVSEAQAALDKYNKDNRTPDSIPGNCDANLQILKDNLQKAKEAEQTAKTELDKVIENAKKAYECAEKLAKLREHVISHPYIKESKETLRSFNEARTEFMSATTDDAKKAAAKKLYELAEKEPDNKTPAS